MAIRNYIRMTNLKNTPIRTNHQCITNSFQLGTYLNNFLNLNFCKDCKLKFDILNKYYF